MAVSGCFLLWKLLSAILLIAVVESGFLLNAIAFIPPILTICFYLFKNNSVSDSHKAKFFSGLRMGGHRGSPHEAPENTIEAFDKAMASSCDLVEFDVHLSSDGVPVLIHDDTTERTAAQGVVVSEIAAHDLRKIPLKPVNGVKAQIPTLNDAVSWCKKKNMKMIIDVKTADRKMIEVLTMTIKENNLYATAIVSSFNPSVAFWIKKFDKNILTGFTTRAGNLSFEDDHRRWRSGNTLLMSCYLIIDDLIDIGVRTFILPHFLGVDMLLLHYKNINSYLAEDALQNEFHVLAWTVNDPQQAAFLRSINVPFLTDFPHLLKDK